MPEPEVDEQDIRDLLIIRSGTAVGIENWKRRRKDLQVRGLITGAPWGWALTAQARDAVTGWELHQVARRKATP